MDHLEEAKRRARATEALHINGEMLAQFNAQLAIAHALIAIAERLPQPTETWSECAARLRQEEQNEG